jgi:uncharacterized protein YcnI
MKKISIAGGILSLFVLFAIPVSAHVVVKPSEVGMGARTNFVVSVPTEEDIPTVGLRLVIPEGVQSVRPNVKPGWTITLKKEGSGEDVKVIEIVWTGGVIPPDQRDEFIFSAQAPAEETTLVWKAYQTYRDGDVVSWDASAETISKYEESGTPVDDDHSGPRPYSQTKIVNDLKDSNENTLSMKAQARDLKRVKTALMISSVAIFAAGVSLWMQFSKKQK